MLQDTILIQELKISTIVGVLEWERHNKQTVSVDLELITDIKNAAILDDLSKTVDYKQVCDNVTALVASSQFKLVESLATAISECVLQDPKIQRVKVTVKKPSAIPHATAVGVCIERSNQTTNS